MGSVNEEIDWINLKSRIDADAALRRHFEEAEAARAETEKRPSIGQRLVSFLTNYPLVNLGFCSTAFFTYAGVRSMRQKDISRSNMMMRGRVASQGFTMAAILGYAFYYGAYQTADGGSADDSDAAVVIAAASADNEVATKGPIGKFSFWFRSLLLPATIEANRHNDSWQRP